MGSALSHAPSFRPPSLSTGRVCYLTRGRVPGQRFHNGSLLGGTMGMRLCLHRGCADGNSTRRALEPKYGPQCPSPANVRVFSGGEAVNQQGRQLRDAVRTQIREAGMARAAQHVPEMTLVNWPPSMRSVVTMPDRKWKRDNVRLGGIQGGTQTDERTRQLNPHPHLHPHPQALELAWHTQTHLH